MAYNQKSSQWYVAKETAYGDKAGLNNFDADGAEVAPTSINFVEAINPTLDASTEMIDREVLKNSMVMAQQVLGKETSSGSMEVEFSTATGVAGSKAVNGDLLYESAMGKRLPDVASVVGTISSGTITIADTSAYSVGGGVKVSGGAGAAEFGVIRTIADGTTMTIAPAPADDHTAFEGMVSFVIASPDAAQISLAIQEYFEGASQSVYTYGGNVVSDVALSFPVANIVKANFSLGGAGFDVANDSNAGQTVAKRNKQCVELDPYVAKNMTFKYGGVAYDIEGLDVKVTGTIYDTEAITTEGLTNKTNTGMSDVMASFNIEYVDTSLFDKFQAGTSGELFGTVSNANSTALIYGPKVVLSEASKSVDSGIYKEAVSAKFLSSGLTCDEFEDAITIAFS